MKITELNPEPIRNIPFLNAGRRPNQFFKDKLPVYHGVIEGLPDSIDCVIATADLQGREAFSRNQDWPPRLLGEVLPALLEETLEELGIADPKRILTLLGGDFYTYEDLRGRGGTGNVKSVWRAISDAYGWVAGVAGNHDTFGTKKSCPPNYDAPTHFLDGNKIKVEGISIAGISGVVGNPEKNFRRTAEDYLETLELMLLDPVDLVLMHDGPDAPELDRARGNPEIRAVLEQTRPGLVVRGHSHWPQPLVELRNGVQVLNVDCTVAILNRS